jgi:hypothetical protein
MPQMMLKIIADKDVNKMALYKLEDFDINYRNHFDKDDIKGLDLYVRDEKVGSVENVLVDDQGQFRYLVISTGFWILGKKVLLPIGHARIDYNDRRVYADYLAKEQVGNLPEFTDNMTVDFEHEEQVRSVYRSSRSMMQQGEPEPSAYGVGYAGADSAPKTVNTSPTLDLEVGYAGYDRDTYRYDREPDLYALDEQNHPRLKLYEERLAASKARQRI